MSRLFFKFSLVLVPILCWVVFSNAENNTKEICFENSCVKAEIADSPEKRADGLMFRKSLGKNEGMLFILEEEGRPGFWMKNMYFSLDIIWMNKSKEVTEVSKGVLPCTDDCQDIIPVKEVKYILEVPAGFADSHHIKPGEKANF
ncbi:MAG TPA: DUF192 domain-containing protein [Candidatus Margulisiibacteriota bacterium]|nr:DUF192 domain-containing protein [Candidatus Margulisiibacteriota bacterium]